MPRRRFYWLIALAFVATVLWRLPARWAFALLPGNVSCEQASGKLWNGACAQLKVAGATLSNLQWQLQAWQFWRGKIGAKIQLRDPQANGSVSLLYGIGGRVQGSDLEANLAVPSALMKSVPNGFSGNLKASLPSFELNKGVPVALQGTVQLQGLTKQQPHLELGDYELVLAENSWQNGALNGTLRDLGGPIRLSGTLMLSAAGAFELNAKLRASRRASVEITQLVEQLGPVDGDGMRTASVAGTL
jgi:hypothetical protein